MKAFKPQRSVVRVLSLICTLIEAVKGIPYWLGLLSYGPLSTVNYISLLNYSRRARSELYWGTLWFQPSVSETISSKPRALNPSIVHQRLMGGALRAGGGGQRGVGLSNTDSTNGPEYFGQNF